MSVLSLPTDATSNTVLSITGQSSTTTSIIAPQSRITLHLDSGVIMQHFRFGSLTRGTILPCSVDERSDINYMVVSSGDNATSQTYLNRLKAFVEKRYGSSETCQSSPIIVLELNHIEFDLVSATKTWLDELQIPNGSGGWITTDPNNFNTTLEARNEGNNSLVKPTAYLMKCWNAASGSPFDLFAMEKWICGRGFWFRLSRKNYPFPMIDSLSADSSYSQRVNNEVTCVKTTVAKIKQCKGDQMPVAVENGVEKLFRL